MKPSPFNFFFPILDGRIVLGYNSYSGAIAEIEGENHPLVQDVLANPNATFAGQAAEYFQCLRDGGFLIPDAVDQRTALEMRARTDRLEGSVLTLTIAPTLACNFGCDYCFESRSSVRMSDETQTALLAFTDRHLYRADGLRLCWFGGEPTLCFPLIERLQQRFLELAEKHQVHLHPGQIITNGYLLDVAMAQRLRELGITRAQITLDGSQEMHDRRRKLHNGQGTFARIIDNLCAAAGILDIDVRINIDKDNVDCAPAAVTVLQERGVLDKVRVTFAPIFPSGAVCADIRDRCHDNAEFARILVRLYGQLAANGIEKIDRPQIASGGMCGAIADGYYSVGPNGYLFKCWEELSLDADRSIGSVFSETLSAAQQANCEAYQAWQPLALSGCRSCAHAPVCMGGCPARGLAQPDASQGVCPPWKYNLGDMLELAYRATMTAQT